MALRDRSPNYWNVAAVRMRRGKGSDRGGVRNGEAGSRRCEGKEEGAGVWMRSILRSESCFRIILNATAFKLKKALFSVIFVEILLFYIRLRLLFDS